METVTTLGEATSLLELHAAPSTSTYRSSGNILTAFVSAVTGAQDGHVLLAQVQFFPKAAEILTMYVDRFFPQELGGLCFSELSF